MEPRNATNNQKQEATVEVKPETAPKNGKSQNPFKPSTTVVPRPKIFLWGEAGAGKTRCSLSLGRAAYISLERGAQYYSEEFDFDLIEPSSFTEIVNSVKWLATNNHDYKTVIIDPITIAWEMCQTEFLEIKKKKRCNPEATIDGGDWRIIKPKYFALLALLRNMNMNVVAIARAGKNYVDSGEASEMLKVDKNDPYAPQAEKSTAYEFDIEIQLKSDKRGGRNRFIATVRKDRTGKLTEPTFEFTGEAIRKYFGQIVDTVGNPISQSNIPQEIAEPICEWCGNNIEAFKELSASETAIASKKHFGHMLCAGCREAAKIQAETQTDNQSEN